MFKRIRKFLKMFWIFPKNKDYTETTMEIFREWDNDEM